ncbi:MAG: hypothetical protein COW84_04775 [Gammaproteobacteria bacterium CG22_combo_CG10-13_8_21_14_all_40_8]|nr:MAG: hypothetical protein COW84_04775 [Gammaproteobacteria bacterium CG22_combo_CG10-13_8_21_14_all_40_8]
MQKKPLSQSHFKPAIHHRWLLLGLLVMILGQTALMHQPQHSLFVDDHCLICVAQANMGSGVAPSQAIPMSVIHTEQILIEPTFHFTISPIKDSRNRSPPAYFS